nr:putative ribonuclease H-like domain-containing protein [Tanacetum cinerariifolium]
MKDFLLDTLSAQSKEQNDKTMKEAKGKSPIESVTGYRDLNVEFQDCSKNNSNEVPTASTTVPTVRKNSLNNTNTFSAASLSNTAEEVYVFQPPGFENPDHPNKVYKVVKALYGLHQALRAWYETLATYLLENDFLRGTIDQTLFI